MTHNADCVPPREAAWAEFRDGPNYTPTDRYPVRDAFDAGWTLAHQMGRSRDAVIDAAHLANQRDWSRETFGPGTRLHGVLDHIRKELREIEDNPTDVYEWVDVLILAFDGAWRAGWEPQQIIDAIKAKQAKNEARTWPDWRTMREDQAIEHTPSEKVARDLDPPKMTSQVAGDDEPECRVIRSGTLGYQRCLLVKGHEGEHRSQDGKTYVTPPGATS